MRFPHLAHRSAAAHKLHSTPQQDRINFSGNDQTSSRLPAFSLFFPGSCPNDRDRRSLGRFSTARFYGIGSIDEAHAYLAHPLLGPRLDLCARIVLASESPSLHAIFGSPDDMKFRSCMTLFSLATDNPENPFRHALNRWCGERRDEQTLALIDAGG